MSTPVTGMGRELSTPTGGLQDIQILPGDMINEYQITGQLGEGGMGIVFEGVQPVIGKRVAIKVLLREFAANEEVVNRFIQEARAANQAQSRYIVDIFSFGELCDGRHYFVMEYLDGEPLREYFDRVKTLDFEQASVILTCMAKGLAAAHETGIIHRDIKPENIIVLSENDGSTSAKVLDFGIAKLQGNQSNPSFVTKTGAALGTPYSMSPEQCRGMDVDHRTDIYAVGIIMFEMFAGQLPFQATSYIELVNKHLFTSPPSLRSFNPGVSDQLEALVLRCISKNPSERPESMRQFISELTALAPSMQKTRPSEPLDFPKGQGHQAAPVAQKSGGKLWLVLLLVLLVLGGGIGAGAYYYFKVYLQDGGGKAADTKKPGVGSKQPDPKQPDPKRPDPKQPDPKQPDPKQPDTKQPGPDTKQPGASPDGAIAKTGKLKIETTPAGAEVFIDGKKQDSTTPLEIEVSRGTHQVKLRLSGHAPLEESVELTKDRQTRRFELVKQAAARARLIIETKNRKAVYFIDGKRVARGASLDRELAPGTYDLKITAPRHRTYKGSIKLEPGITLNLERRLKRRGNASKKPQGGNTQEDPDAPINPFKNRKR